MALTNTWGLFGVNNDHRCFFKLNKRSMINSKWFFLMRFLLNNFLYTILFYFTLPLKKIKSRKMFTWSPQLTEHLRDIRDIKFKIFLLFCMMQKLS